MDLEQDTFLFFQEALTDLFRGLIESNDDREAGIRQDISFWSFRGESDFREKEAGEVFLDSFEGRLRGNRDLHGLVGGHFPLALISTNVSEDFHEALPLFLRGRENELLLVFRIGFDHRRIKVSGQRKIEFFPDERAIGIDHEDDGLHDEIKSLLHAFRHLGIRKRNLGHFKVKTAEIVIDEIVKGARGRPEFVRVHLGSDFLDGFLETAQDEFIQGTKFFGVDFAWDEAFAKRGLDIASRIPDLVQVILSGLQFFIAVTHIEPRGAIRRDEIAKGVNAVFGDDIDRIDPVSEGFRHLPSLFVSNQTMDNDLLEGGFSGEMLALEDHARDPEENDVVTGVEDRGWEITIEIFGLFGPTQGRERP